MTSRPPISKRGLGWPWNNPASQFSLYADAISAQKLCWLFNWELWKPEGHPAGLEYVPQVRTAKEAPQIDQFLSGLPPQDRRHFIGFNEPDIVDQANMSVADAVQLWNQFVLPAKHKFGFRLGSPAISSAPRGKQWLTQFFQAFGDGGGADTAGVDFVVVHWYGWDGDEMGRYLEDMSGTFGGKPLWLTEFAYSHLRTEPPVPESQQVQNFMSKTVPALDADDRVERYAYFGAPTDVGEWVGRASNFTDKGERLTAVGRMYCEL